MLPMPCVLQAQLTGICVRGLPVASWVAPQHLRIFRIGPVSADKTSNLFFPPGSQLQLLDMYRPGDLAYVNLNQLLVLKLDTDFLSDCPAD